MPVSNANTKGTHSGTESTENTMRYAHNLGSTARRKHRLEASAATSTSARASSVGKLELTWYSQLRWTKASFSLNHPQEVRELWAAVVSSCACFIAKDSKSAASESAASESAASASQAWQEQ